MAQWPLAARALALLLLLLYIPVIREVAQQSWLHDDTYTHGLLVLPTALALVWHQRERLHAAVYAPQERGLWLLLAGLLMLAFAWLLHIKLLMIVSLVPVLSGCTLALHGRALERETRFAVLFLLFAAPIPLSLLNIVGAQVQRGSTLGAVQLMGFLGYTLHRSGNVIDVPGMRLEVAQACSGFNKLFALTAFAVLYGHIYGLPLVRRGVLILSTLPIALLANVLRIAALGIIATSFGPRMEAMAHDPAELSVILLSCLLFIVLGHLLGCRENRFASGPRSAPGKAAAGPSPRGTTQRLQTSKIAIALVCGTLILNIASASIPQVRPILLPVHTFPTQVGDWKRIRELPVDASVQKALASATIVEREYQDRMGRIIFLRLLTSTDYRDFHDPRGCLPNQGNHIDQQKEVEIVKGQKAIFLHIISDRGDRSDIAFWLPGDHTSISYLGAHLPFIETLRHLLTGEQGGSLVVLLSQPDDEQGGIALHDFAQQIRKPLNAILESGRPGTKSYTL